MKVAPDHTGRASGRSWVPGAGRPWGGYRGSRQTRAQNCRAKGLWSPGGPWPREQRLDRPTRSPPRLHGPPEQAFPASLRGMATVLSIAVSSSTWKRERKQGRARSTVTLRHQRTPATSGRGARVTQAPRHSGSTDREAFLHKSSRWTPNAPGFVDLPMTRTWGGRASFRLGAWSSGAFLVPWRGGKPMNEPERAELIQNVRPRGNTGGTRIWALCLSLERVRWNRECIHGVQVVVGSNPTGPDQSQRSNPETQVTFCT